MPYSKTHQQKVKDYIQNAKNIPCKDCGLYKLDQMTFDHLPEKGKKKFTIAGSKHRSFKAVKEEIAKCEIVCRTCHDKREYTRGVFGSKDQITRQERNRRRRQRWRINKKRRKTQALKKFKIVKRRDLYGHG